MDRFVAEPLIGRAFARPVGFSQWRDLCDNREGDSVERLMGSKAEARFAFISDKAEFASEDLLDV